MSNVSHQCQFASCHFLMYWRKEEMFYLTTHSTHFIYGYMASDIWLRTILILRKKTRCRHIDYSFWLTGRILLYAPSHRQDSTYHSLCYTSSGELAGTRNSSMGPPRRIIPTVIGKGRTAHCDGTVSYSCYLVSNVSHQSQFTSCHFLMYWCKSLAET